MGVLQLFLRAFLIRPTQGVIEMAVKDWLRDLGDIRNIAHFLFQLLQSFLLKLQLLLQFLTFAVVAQGLALVLIEVLHALANALLSLGELARAGSHLPHFLLKLVRGFLAKFLFQLLQTLLGAVSRGERLGRLPLLEVLLRPADILTNLLQLLAGLGHLVAVFRLLHPLLKFVHILAQLPLLLLQPLQLLAKLFLLLRGVRLLKRGLQFLDLLVQILLPLRQLAQPVQDLKLLAFLRVVLLLIDRLPLGFIAILLGLHLQLIELPLLTLLAALFALLLLLLLRDLKLLRLQLQQRLIGRSFARHRPRQRLQILLFLRRFQFPNRFAHVALGLFQKLQHLGIFDLRPRLIGL